ncbi:MAG: serine hydrolase [Hyphomonadaceae bacterium]|nr:serine hydrolase [Hyphomonadaceae bacterium]
MLKSFAALAVAFGLFGCTAVPAQQQTSNATWNASALEDVVAYAQSQKTTGFLIIQDGKTIAEHNWPLPDDAASKTFRANFVHGVSADGALKEDVASQQKSLIALLVGVGVDKGLIDIERPVSAYIGSRWSKATPQQEEKITVRHLLEMNSGLKEDLSFDAPAGTKFLYNTPAYAKLKPVLEKAAGQELWIVTQLWFTKVGNMHGTGWEQRPGVFSDVGNPTGLVTTPRDLAIMGQIILNRGRKPNGAQLISEAQLDAIFTPTATNPSYGRLWWLNNSTYSIGANAGATRREGQLIPSAPRDLVAALGAQDRKLFIVPSMKLLVIRTGQAAPDRQFDEHLWEKLMKALPAS